MSVTEVRLDRWRCHVSSCWDPLGGWRL